MSKVKQKRVLKTKNKKQNGYIGPSFFEKKMVTKKYLFMKKGKPKSNIYSLGYIIKTKWIYLTTQFYVENVILK